MNNFLKLSLKSAQLRSIAFPLRSTVQMPLIRCYSSTFLIQKSNVLQTSQQIDNIRLSHTKVSAQRELVEFLTEEIMSERKNQKTSRFPTEVDGFMVKLNGAEVTMTKDIDGEKTKISFNVNHSVDGDEEPSIEDKNPDQANELKSKPTFKVEIQRDGVTLALMCSFIGSDQHEDGYNDVFGIDEMSIYEGEWHEHTYSVSGEVVDACLYDLLLNYLEEKGISSSFVQKISDYSTAYEHSAYISLLEGLSKFASGKKM